MKASTRLQSYVHPALAVILLATTLALILTLGDADPSRGQQVEGNPAIDGRFAVGETLTADTSTITDTDGLTSPTYTYQWARVDATASANATDISTATASTYTVVAADAGHRLRVTVSFTDDASNAETRSVATSYIPHETRILVSSWDNSTSGVPSPERGLWVTFTAGNAGSKYRVSSAEWQFSTPSGLDPDTFLAGLYTTHSSRLPNQQVARLDNPSSLGAGSRTFKAPAEALIDGGTRYALPLFAGPTGRFGCGLATGADSSSLTGWSIGTNTPVLSTSPTTHAGTFISNPCRFRVRGYQVTDAPHITSLAVTGSPTAAGIYSTGETIEITATLSEATTIDGPNPVLPITVGSNTREAEYSAADSTTTSWVFHYTVQSDDRDEDGLSIEEHALRGYAAADLGHNAIDNDDEALVNPRALVESIRVTSRPEAPNWYGPGEIIQFTARFTLPVRVEGDPQFGFNSNNPSPDPAELADFVMVSEDGREVVFEYKVSTTDNDSDGIWLWDQTMSFRLDSDDAIVADYDGRNAVLDHSEHGKQENHRITQNPRVVSIEVTSDPAHGTDSDYYYLGNQIQFTATFNQPVTVTGDPEFEFSITSGGTADERAAYLRGSGTRRLVFSYEVLAADMDTDGIWIGGSDRTFKLDSDDSIQGTSNSLNANFSHQALNHQRGHNVDGSMTPDANTASTGFPTITAPNATFLVPAELSVDLSGITDANGATNIAQNATYNWQRFLADGTTLDTDGIGAGPTYTLTSDDAGKTIKVEVYFTDDDGHSEGPRTSASTSIVFTVLVSNTGVSETHQHKPLGDFDVSIEFTTGTGAGSFILDSVEVTLRTRSNTVTPTMKLLRGSATGTEVATLSGPASLDANSTKAYSFSPSSSVTLSSGTNYGITLEGGQADVVRAETYRGEEAAEPGWTLRNESRARSDDSTGPFNIRAFPMLITIKGYPSILAQEPATGEPEIGAPNNVFSVPAELYVYLGGIMDVNGVENIADSATYVWKRFAADGTTLEDDSVSTAAIYTLTDSDVGKTFKVEVSFNDDGANAEGPLTSAATEVIMAAEACPPAPLCWRCGPALE